MNPPRVHRVRRVVIVVPSLFTLANLFFGVWSMVLAWHGEFYRAAWFIVIAGVLDMLDGAMARRAKAGTRFGAELDSLVDIVSFGVAPASLTYLWFFATEGQYAWVFSYAFVVCVALRLARYNVQLTGEHKSTFSGLPSPAATAVAEQAMRTEGLMVDPVYTAKALSLVPRQPGGGNVVFWHTGGLLDAVAAAGQAHR